MDKQSDVVVMPRDELERLIESLNVVVTDAEYGIFYLEGAGDRMDVIPLLRNTQNVVESAQSLLRSRLDG